MNSLPPESASPLGDRLASEPRLSGDANGDRAESDRGDLEQTISTAPAPDGPKTLFGGLVDVDPVGATQRLTASGIVLVAIVLMLVGLGLNNSWMVLAAAIVTLLICLRTLWLPVRNSCFQFAASRQGAILIAGLGGVVATIALLDLVGYGWIAAWFSGANWDAIGALGEVIGAVGQILIAMLAVYVAWRQYVIEKDLTTQQNTITQQQTIDSYFQGISELVLDDEGLLEDWPQERAIAEGRTAAILSSVDSQGKAKIIRFLSRARLLTPLKRDQRLGRAILDGMGGYEEDRLYGIRVIELGIMLAGANLAGTDLRWTDLSGTNLIRANLHRGDLVKTNLSRSILVDANLREADLNGTRFYYGSAEAATPRNRTEPPNYRTGEQTGAVIEGADFTNVSQLSQEQRYYCCAWGGSRTRRTIPGGCTGIPNKLGH